MRNGTKNRNRKLEPETKTGNRKIYIPPPVTLELLRVRPALEPEPEGSPPDGTPADKVEVTVELFGIPLPPPPLPPLEWSGNLSRSQRTEPEKEGIFYKIQ